MTRQASCGSHTLFLPYLIAKKKDDPLIQERENFVVFLKERRS